MVVNCGLWRKERKKRRGQPKRIFGGDLPASRNRTVSVMREFVRWWRLKEISGTTSCWYGHVQRMSKERLPEQVLDWVPPRKRRRGRPIKRWRQGVDEEMMRCQLPDNHSEDRHMWRLGVAKRQSALSERLYLHHLYESSKLTGIHAKIRGCRHDWQNHILGICTKRNSNITSLLYKSFWFLYLGL